MGYNKLSADPTSLILGVVSIVIIVFGCCCGFIALIALGLSITGLVLANKSLKEYALDPEVYDHKSRSNVNIGRILCIVGLAISSLFIVIWALYFIFVGEELSKKILEQYQLNSGMNYEIGNDTIKTDYDQTQEIDSLYMDSLPADTVHVDTIKVN